ncbi:MAG: DNA repair protein RecO [Firmicutes bacterium]|nr:DNA repair protein RecO [Bacillota bacterium]
MIVTVKGLIIKETKFGEGDKIITILTPDFGIIQAVAKGARSYKSKFLAGSQLFCYTNFGLTKRGKMFSLSFAEPIHTFYEIRKSVEKISLSVYFCELLSEVCTDSHQADAALRLALNTLFKLSKNDNLAQIKASFELRLISDAGFTPELSCCVKCGRTGHFNLFSANDGGVQCCDCCGSGNALSAGTIRAISHIITCELKKVFAYEADENVLFELEHTAENYILCQIGRLPQSLKYYQKLKINR